MTYRPDGAALAVTALTLAAAGAGAGLGWLVGLPAHLLTGPAILVSAMAALGVPVAIAPPVRDAAFLVIGVGIGAGMDERAAAAMARWPLALLALAAMLTAALALSALILRRGFGFDGRSAVLAAAPGHLSFVIGLGEALGADVARVTIVQSVRLLALTLVTPFVAIGLGVEFEAALAPPGPAMAALDLALVFAAAIGAGVLLMRLGAPAPLLIGAMVVSALAHLTGAAPGVMAPELAMAGFVTVGALIGARFSGLDFRRLRGAALAGVATTSVTVVLTLLTAIPVALALAMPTAHVLVAFAPGGLETMIAMGAVLGANPGFLVACHVSRLLLLTVLVPAMLPRDRQPG